MTYAQNQAHILLVDVVRRIDVNHCCLLFQQRQAGHLEAQVGLAGARSPADFNYLVAGDGLLEAFVQARTASIRSDKFMVMRLGKLSL